VERQPLGAGGRADLTGLLLGATLATRAEEIYRALIEATAFGTRVIIEAFAGAAACRSTTSWPAAACRRRTAS
jgi:glycerol kinase